MKTFISTILTVQLFTMAAYAKYDCISDDGQSNLKVVDRIHHFGNVIVDLKSSDGSITFYGYKTTEGTIYTKENITFRSSSSTDLDLNNAVLIISHAPRGSRGCGRGECNSEGLEEIWAVITIKNTKSYFKCNEYK